MARSFRKCVERSVVQGCRISPRQDRLQQQVIAMATRHGRLQVGGDPLRISLLFISYLIIMATREMNWETGTIKLCSFSRNLKNTKLR